MAFFILKDQKSRSLRKNVWLRINCDVNQDVHEVIKRAHMDKHTLERIVILNILPKDKVLLEIWFKDDYTQFVANERITKFTVIHVVVPENPEWVCESDVGRGFVERKKK